jgi:hypothetical protein
VTTISTPRRRWGGEGRGGHGWVRRTGNIGGEGTISESKQRAMQAKAESGNTTRLDQQLQVAV